MFNTDAVHPAGVSRDTGEDGGFPEDVAAGGRHKAGHTVDNPPPVDAAVQGATGVTLDSEITH